MFPLQLRQSQVDDAAAGPVELSAEMIWFGPFEQYLRGIKIMDHHRMQWILAGEVPDDAGWSMTHAIDV